MVKKNKKKLEENVSNNTSNADICCLEEGDFVSPEALHELNKTIRKDNDAKIIDKEIKEIKNLRIFALIVCIIFLIMFYFSYKEGDCEPWDDCKFKILKSIGH